MSKLKSVFARGEGIDEKIDSAFSPSGSSPAKTSFSERVLDSQQKFGNQFNGASAPKKFGESSPSQSAFSGSRSNDDFGRFDPDFVSDKHLDDFDETKNIENFKRAEPTPMPSKLAAKPVAREEFHELATATPRRNVAPSGPGDLTRVIEELEDVRAQNGEILRRIQRIEEKLRR